MRRLRNALFCALLGAACNPVTAPVRDTGLGGLALTSVAPAAWLPTTTVHVFGLSFVPIELGTATLVLANGTTEIHAPLQYESPSEMTFSVGALDNEAALGNDTAQTWSARVEYESTVDHASHPSASLSINVTHHASLTPTLSAVGDGVAYVNSAIPIVGDGLLLDGEGTTNAVLTGCFRAQPTATCGTPVTLTLPVTPTNSTVRTDGNFVYATSISGIGAGEFAGTMHLENASAGGTTQSSEVSVDFQIQPATLTGISTNAASLGQYVVLTGGGFVGGGSASASDETTTLHLAGAFTPDDNSAELPIDVVLVPEFRSGTELRYVLDESDALGQVIALRTQSGALAVTVTLTVEKGSDSATTPPAPVALTILPVRQVVYINFLDEWVSSLRRFGLRAADPSIRQRILAVAGRDYTGVNMDFRLTVPTDFSVFSQVDLAGLYPAGDHSFGYDNTPGKDAGNLRLYDLVGGVNAVSQQGGAPGYGGVFLESFFLFSEHPPTDIKDNLQDDPTWPLVRVAMFDQIFDPFRADRGGTELTATELAELQPPSLTSTASCPADKHDRQGQIACAIYVMGNMIGTTMTHEVGHSLGLSDPYGPNTHNVGDCTSRLMDGGAYRPFTERSEIGGDFGRFCVDDYVYLRQILPGLNLTPPDLDRPICTACPM